MVSLNQQEGTKLRKVSNVPEAIECLLWFRQFDADTAHLVKLDQIIPALAASILSSDKLAYESALTFISQRKLTRDSDWPFNDYLLFVLAVGYAKFESGKEFTLEVVDLRSQIQNEDALSIVYGVSALLTKAESTDFLWLRFLCETLGGQEAFDPAYVKRAYTQSLEYQNSAAKNDFSMRLSERVASLAIEHSEFSTVQPSFFYNSFGSRIIEIGRGISYGIAISTVVLFMWMVWLNIFGLDQTKYIASLILAIFGILGFGKVADAKNFVPICTKFIAMRIARFFAKIPPEKLDADLKRWLSNRSKWNSK